VNDLIDVINEKLSLIKKKQNYQIVLDVKNNVKLYLDELNLFYKKYLMHKLKKKSNYFNKKHK